MTTPILSWPILFRPDRVAQSLRRVEAAGLVDPVPNVWQISLGVVRMWHRLAFRSETVGLSTSDPQRPGWRARVLAKRPIRFPFLLRERAIAPLDFSGMLSSPERVRRHLLGAHHDAQQFVYDFQLLSCTPDELQRLRTEAVHLVENDEPRSRWLRDLVVFEGYHERLLAALDRFLDGNDGLSDEERADPDISFVGYLRWCAAQPETPAATASAIRAGTFSLTAASC